MFNQKDFNKNTIKILNNEIILISQNSNTDSYWKKYIKIIQKINEKRNEKKFYFDSFKHMKELLKFFINNKNKLTKKDKENIIKIINYIGKYSGEIFVALIAEQPFLIEEGYKLYLNDLPFLVKDKNIKEELIELFNIINIKYPEHFFLLKTDLGLVNLENFLELIKLDKKIIIDNFINALKNSSKVRKKFINNTFEYFFELSKNININNNEYLFFKLLDVKKIHPYIDKIFKDFPEEMKKNKKIKQKIKQIKKTNNYKFTQI